MNETTLSTAFGVSFALVGGATVWLMLQATARMKQKGASARLIQAHRAGGYIFIANQVFRFERDEEKAMEYMKNLHANIGPELAKHADIVSTYRTTPHVDMYETAIRAGELSCEPIAVCPTSSALPAVPVPAIVSIVSVGSAIPSTLAITIWTRWFPSSAM